VEPPVPTVPGETYVEWRVEGETTEPCDIFVGIGGDDAADGVRDGEDVVCLVAGIAM
jgi:hypothetical protein